MGEFLATSPASQRRRGDALGGPAPGAHLLRGCLEMPHTPVASAGAGAAHCPVKLPFLEQVSLSSWQSHFSPRSQQLHSTSRARVSSVRPGVRWLDHTARPGPSKFRWRGFCRDCAVRNTSWQVQQSTDESHRCLAHAWILLRTTRRAIPRTGSRRCTFPRSACAPPTEQPPRRL